MPFLTFSRGGVSGFSGPLVLFDDRRFGRAKYGPPPYRLLSVVFEAEAAKCARCKRAITPRYVLCSADGREFSVCCRCVDAGHSTGASRDAPESVLIPRLLGALLWKFDTPAKAEVCRADVARIEAAKKRYFLVESVLDAQSSPHGSYVGERTLAEWCAWMFVNSGRTGQLKAARVVEACPLPGAQTTKKASGRKRKRFARVAQRAILRA